MRPPAASCIHRVRANLYIMYTHHLPYVPHRCMHRARANLPAPGWHARANLPITPHTPLPALASACLRKRRRASDRKSGCGQCTHQRIGHSHFFIFCSVPCPATADASFRLFAPAVANLGIIGRGFVQFWGIPFYFCFLRLTTATQATATPPAAIAVPAPIRNHAQVGKCFCGRGAMRK